MQDLTRVRVLKLDEKHLQHIEDDVVVEEPLEVRVNGESFSVTMRTPGDDFDLAIGLFGRRGSFILPAKSEPWHTVPTKSSPN